MKYKDPRMPGQQAEQLFFFFLRARYFCIPLKLNEHILTAASYSTRLRVGVRISSFTIALWEIKWVPLQQFPCPSLEASEIYFPQTVHKMLLFFLNLISPCKSGVPEIKLRFQFDNHLDFFQVLVLGSTRWLRLNAIGLPAASFNSE